VRSKTPSAVLSVSPGSVTHFMYAPSPGLLSALHLRLWPAFSDFDRPDRFSAGHLSGSDEFGSEVYLGGFGV